MNWNDEIKAAQDHARDAAAPFAPSMKQIEESIQPMIDRLLAMPDDEAKRVVTTGIQHVNAMAWGMMVIARFKQRKWG